MEVMRSHDLSSAIWKSRKDSGIIQFKSKFLRTKGVDSINPGQGQEKISDFFCSFGAMLLFKWKWKNYTIPINSKYDGILQHRIIKRDRKKSWIPPSSAFFFFFFFQDFSSTHRRKGISSNAGLIHKHIHRHT